MSVQRYICLANGVMKESGDNPKHLREWVLASDYDALERQVAESKHKGHDIELVGEGDLASCPRCYGGEVQLEESCADRLVVQRNALQREVAQLKEQLKGIACEVCWTNSWVPIETKEQADGVNVKTDSSSMMARCDHCWIQQAIQRDLDAARLLLRKAGDQLRPSMDDETNAVHEEVEAYFAQQALAAQGKEE